jgi:hypothetical protein
VKLTLIHSRSSRKLAEKNERGCSRVYSGGDIFGQLDAEKKRSSGSRNE